MKKKFIIISILTIIVLIPISATIKVKYMQKQLDEERLSYTLCNRETFTDQLEYIANEQAVYYNLFDGDNLYKEKELPGENTFKKYMEEQGWKYEVTDGTDFANEIIFVSFEKNDIEIYYSSERGGLQNYYKIDGILIIYIDGEKNPPVETYAQHRGDFEYIDEIATHPEDYDDLNEKNKYKDIGEEMFSEFMTDIENYNKEICSP